MSLPTPNYPNANPRPRLQAVQLVTLPTLGDVVDTIAPAHGEVLKYDSGLAQWVSAVDSSSGVFEDSVFRVHDDADATKLLSFQLGSVTTGQTRELTVQDSDGTIATLEADQTFAQSSHVAPKIWNPLNTFRTSLRIGNITADSDVTLGIVGPTEVVSMQNRQETLTNKTLGTNVRLLDSDGTNLYFFSPGNLTTNVNVNFPPLAANDTLVMEDHAATLINKTLDDATNVVRSTSLATTTAPVVVSGAVAPSAGQVLTASSATAAAWSSVAAAPVTMSTLNINAVACQQGNIVIASGLAAGQSIDSVTLNTGFLVLLTEQTVATENGLYIAPASGAASRAPQLPTAADASKLRFNATGGQHCRGLWMCRNDSVSAVVDTHNLGYVNTSKLDYGDDELIVTNAADTSKQVQFSAASVGAGTTRTMTIPNASGTISLVGHTHVLADVTDALTVAATFTNKAFSTGTSIRDSDNSHAYNLTPGNLTGNVQLNLPAITGSADTIVVTTFGQTLSNKNITDTGSVIRGTELATTGASVQLAAGAPPSAGQVLTASTATAASWATPTSFLSRQWFSDFVRDTTNINELEYFPANDALSPANMGCWVMPRAATLTGVTLVILDSAAEAITAGTMTLSIGTRSLADVYTNIGTLGTLTSILNANGQLVVTGLAHVFATGDRVVLRLQTDASFAWSGGTNADVRVVAEFSS